MRTGYASRRDERLGEALRRLDSGRSTLTADELEWLAARIWAGTVQWLRFGRHAAPLAWWGHVARWAGTAIPLAAAACVAALGLITWNELAQRARVAPAASTSVFAEMLTALAVGSSPMDWLNEPR